LARYGRNVLHNTLAGGQKWPELLHMAEKHLKKHKENKGKNR
jgi:hypothetical protein